MTTQLNLRYDITTSADTNTVATTGDYSIADSLQSQISYNTNSLVDPTAKKIEIAAYPTLYQTPTADRVYDIDLDSLQLKYLRLISATSENQFLISMAPTAEDLDTGATAIRTLNRVYFNDFGAQPNTAVFMPDISLPRFIRIINPLEVNGGGTGNDVSDIPIIVSIILVCDKGFIS